MRAMAPRPGHGAQDALADHGVLAHHRPLELVERAGLVEHLVRDRDLADVVQQRGLTHAVDLDLVERELLGDARGEVDHELGVLAGVAIALQQRLGEARDRVALRVAADAAAVAIEVRRALGAAASGLPGGRSRRSASATSSAAVCRAAQPATPTEAETASTGPTRVCSSTSRMRSKACSAAADWVSGSRTRNSSAPARASTSLLRRLRCSRPATTRSRSSPRSRPCDLLSAPKPSMSSAASDSGTPVAARALDLGVRGAGRRPAEVCSPVSGSRWVRAASSCSRSWMRPAARPAGA